MKLKKIRFVRKVIWKFTVGKYTVQIVKEM